MSDHKQECRVCGNYSNVFASARILPDNLNKDVEYGECPNCGYIQTENPYWLDIAYKEVINYTDTGILQRNLKNAKYVIASLIYHQKLRGKVVDAAGGLGILTRLLRDYGVDAYWKDKFCDNLLARGFEYKEGTVDLVTTFESFEHFVDPNLEIDHLLEISPNILFSTKIVPSPTPMPYYWWYYGLEHGQHIGFFKVKTLQYLAKLKGKHLLTDGKSIHLFTDRKSYNISWRILLRVTPFVYFIAKHSLTSKTWFDHFHLSKTKSK